MDEVMKVNVVAKDGNVTIGTPVVVLNDESSIRFTTDSVDAFVKYVLEKGAAEWTTYISSSINANNAVLLLEAVPNKASVNAMVMARCTAMISSPLQALRGLVNCKLDLNELEEKLSGLRKYASKDQAVLDTINRVRRMTLRKTIKMDQSVDQNGNFHYLLSFESEKEDYVPPKAFIFKVPLLLRGPVNTEVTIEVEPLFRYQLKGDGQTQAIEMWFVLRCLDWDEQVLMGIEAMANRLLYMFKNAEAKAYWGGAKLEVHTDEWKYKEQPFRIQT